MAKSFDREIQRILREEILLEESLNPRRTAALVRSERGVRKELQKWLRQSNLDTKALDELRTERERGRRREARMLRQLASRQSAAQHKSVVARAREFRGMARPAAGLLPAEPMTIVLERAHRISTFPDSDVLTFSRIRAGNNTAKIRVDRRDRGRDRLNFLFLWENTSSESVIVDADATLSATGFLDLHVNNGLLGNVGFLDASTRMSLRRFLLPFGAASGPDLIGSILAFNYPWWPAEDSFGTAIGTVDHSVRGFPLAGNATVMISVSLTVFSDFEDGRGVADFDSGSLGVGVPQVTLTVTTRPNMLVARG